MKRSGVVKTLAVIAALAGAAVAGGALLVGGDPEPQLRTTKVTRGDIADVVSASGSLGPARVLTVGTQVSGQVSKLTVGPNDEVKAGQLLAEIDPTLLLAQIRQDRTALETARSNFEQAGRDVSRTRMLLAADYVARVDLEHAEQAYRAARNSYDAAKTVVDRDEANLGYTKILAPIDGVILSSDVELGQTLAASLQAPTLFRIAGDLTRMKINASLPEAFISKVKAGMEAKFTVDAFPGREFAGTVATVNLNPTSQGSGVTYSVEVRVDNPGRELLPGMTAYVSLTMSKRENVLRVPAPALRFSPQAESPGGLRRLFARQPGSADAPPVAKEGKAVYVLRYDRPVRVAVMTGATDDNYVEVSGDGIAEGDAVIVGTASGRP